MTKLGLAQTTPSKLGPKSLLFQTRRGCLVFERGRSFICACSFSLKGVARSLAFAIASLAFATSASRLLLVHWP